MKKDIMTEKAARAFRSYARLGLAYSRSAIEIVCKIRGICSDNTALDMLAVFDTLRMLEFLGDKIAIRAVRDVYFATSKAKPLSNETTLRIRRLADEAHCDDRTVYRRLKRARDMWEFIRAKEAKQTAGKRSLLGELIT
jgi:hypothetical protein